MPQLTPQDPVIFPTSESSDTEHYFYKFEIIQPPFVEINLSNLITDPGGAFVDIASESGTNLDNAFRYNTDSSTANVVDIIVLPVQSSIKEKSEVNYNETGMKGANQLSNIAAQITGGGDGVLGDVLGSVLSNTMGELSGKGGLIGDLVTISERLTGSARNQFLEVVFEGPKRRSYSFEWTLVARNENDAKAMNRIKRLFQFHMHPNLSADRSFYLYPNILKFSVEERVFLSDEDGIDKVPRVTTREVFASKACVIDDFEVEYGDDRFNMFVGPSVTLPGIMKLSLSLTEIEFFLQKDFDRGEF
jgi:hypothetical protein